MAHVVGSDHHHIRNVLTFSIVSPECHYAELYTVYEQHRNRQSSVYPGSVSRNTCLQTMIMIQPISFGTGPAYFYLLLTI